MNGPNSIHIIYKNTNRELLNLIMGTKSGKTRIKILDELLIRPYNANQLATKLNLDYKTITYHMNIICKYQFATKDKLGKYTIYSASDKLIKHIDEYNDIKNYYNKIIKV